MKGRIAKKQLTIFLCLCFILVAVPACSTVFATGDSPACSTVFAAGYNRAGEGERAAYSFDGRGEESANITHSGIVAAASGLMDMNVSELDEAATVTVKLVDADTGEAVAAEAFSDTGGRQCFIEEGSYRLDVTIDSGDGDCSYRVELLMPEAGPVSVPEEEAPLAQPTLLPEEDPAGLGTPWALMIVGTAVVLVAVGLLSYRRIRKNN